MVITKNNKPLIIERIVRDSRRVISMISETPLAPSECVIYPITFSSSFDVYIDGIIFEFTNPIWVLCAGQQLSATDQSFYDEDYLEILIPFEVIVKRNSKKKNLWDSDKINEKFMVVNVSPIAGVYVVVNSAEFNAELILKKHCAILAQETEFSLHKGNKSEQLPPQVNPPPQLLKTEWPSSQISTEGIEAPMPKKPNVLNKNK